MSLTKKEAVGLISDYRGALLGVGVPYSIQNINAAGEKLLNAVLTPATTQLESIEKFHRAFGAPVASEPCIPSEERLKLRCTLILEECLEFIEAAGFEVCVDNLTETLADGYTIQQRFNRRPASPNMIGMCDALKDIQVVTLGTEVEMGIQKVSEPMFNEVMASNMSKLGENGEPIYRAEDGKILKGPNFFKPNLEQFLPSLFILGEK